MSKVNDDAAIDALIRECGGVPPLELVVGDTFHFPAPATGSCPAVIACADCGNIWVAVLDGESLPDCPNCGGTL